MPASPLTRRPLPAWLLPAVLVALAVLPIAVAPIPGLADLPNHIARHHVLYHYAEGGPLTRHFDVQWRWIGNLGVDLPTLLLMHAMSAEAATRIVVAVIAPLTVLAILALSRAAHGRISAGAMLAMPLVFHQAYLYGFANYCLGVALALLVFAAYLVRPPEGWRRALGYVALSVLVWTTHLGGWTVLVVAAGCAELVQLRAARDLLPAARRLLPLATPLIPLLLWRGASHGPAFRYATHDLLWSKIMNFVAVLKGWSRTPDLAMTGAIGLLALLALFWAGRRRLDPRLLAAGIGVCLLCTAMPITVLGSWGADFRLAPIGLILLLLAITPAADPRRERLLFAAGGLLFAVRAIGIAVQWHRASAVLDRRLQILDAVPRGSRMGFLAVSTSCHIPWELTPDRKLPGLAIARRDVFTNTMFKVEGADLMTIRDPHDRATWFDQSEDVDAVCPQSQLDRPALAARLADMAHDRFDTVWVWGMPADRIPVPAGYRITSARGKDTLLARIPG